VKERSIGFMDYVFLALGPFLLITGLIILIKRRKFVKESTVINGVVSEIKIGIVRRNRKAYYPVVRYFDPVTASEETYESNTSYEASSFRIGDKVELRYLNNGMKKQLCINTWFGIWGLSFMLILFGLIFCAIDYPLIFCTSYFYP
jgi:hypothetical protein